MPLIRKHFSNPHGLWLLYEEVKDVYTRPSYDRDHHAVGAQKLLEGTEGYNAEIAKLWDTLWENVPSLRNTWQLSMAGAFPSVPVFLAGEPESMLRLSHEQHSYAPLRIWIGITSSGGIEREQLIKRGAALTVFAQALSEIRPVLLTPYTACGEQYQRNHDNDVILSWDIQASPLVLSEAAASLCETRVSRDLIFKITNALTATENHREWSGNWAWKYEDETTMRELLGAEPDDLWLGSIHLYDELLMNPIQWIQKHLDTYVEDESRWGT